jgi:NAD(P)-dependent dehydrogenase (short-subunit alcohol dehydrogenase family)
MLSNPVDLTGHVALVTGASRGIGRAIARRLAAHGVAVVATSSARSGTGLRETGDSIRQAGGRAEVIECDLADAGARGHLIARAGEWFGPVDILINNAAAIPAYAPPSRMDLSARHTLFEINLQAPIDLAQQALPTMRLGQWGRVVNISSEMVRQPRIPYPGPAKFVHALALYGASKAALERYTAGLAAELHGSGISASCVAPYRIAASEGAAQVVAQTATTHPDWVEPVEMLAEAVLVLVATGLTGLVLNSREVLQLAQQPLHSLDGLSVIGDATTLYGERRAASAAAGGGAGSSPEPAAVSGAGPSPAP